jgi:hypothetical protein
VVIITNYLVSLLGDPGQLRDTRDAFVASDGRVVRSGSEKVELYLEALKRFSTRAAQRGVTVVVVGAGPRHPDTHTCSLDWFNLQHKGTCERTVSEELAAARALNQRLERELPRNVWFYDPIPVLCREGCDNARVRRILRDTDHLSVPGARRLGPSFLEFLNGLPSRHAADQGMLRPAPLPSPFTPVGSTFLPAPGLPR